MVNHLGLPAYHHLAVAAARAAYIVYDTTRTERAGWTDCELTTAALWILQNMVYRPVTHIRGSPAAGCLAAAQPLITKFGFRLTVRGRCGFTTDTPRPVLRIRCLNSLRRR